MCDTELTALGYMVILNFGKVNPRQVKPLVAAVLLAA